MAVCRAPVCGKGRSLMESLVLALFVLILALCLLLGLPTLLALAAGYILFCIYGLRKGFSLRSLLSMSLSGIRTVKNILLLFVLLGVLTALWRSAGTIPVIVSYAALLVRPSLLLILSFLLNALVSFLTGSCFGTSATTGVICMTMAAALDVNPILAGGAVLSGAYFGDRCSPISTSALLVAALTETDIFQNIRGMVRTALVPFFLSCAFYLALGPLSAGGGGSTVDVRALFSREFQLGWAALLPAVVLLLLSLRRVNVMLTMLCSIAAALIVSLVLQGAEPLQLLRFSLTGYQAGDPSLVPLLNGGGIASMFNVAAIVCIASTYAGIFRETGLLDGLQAKVEALGRRTTPFFALFCTAAATALLVCNQSLCIMLTRQMCGQLVPAREDMALDLENTAVLLPALVPWSIACAVPLSTISAPTLSLLAACYIYLVPLCQLLRKGIPQRAAQRAEN